MRWKGKSARFPNKTQPDALCNIPLGDEFLVFTLVPFFRNFIFMDCFELETEDLMVLIEDLTLLIIILRTLS